MEVKSVVPNDSWEIYNDGKLIASIKTFYGFRNNTKLLHLGTLDEDGKKVAEIRNQKEAVKKLEAFFEQNKLDIKEKEKLIEQLSSGIAQMKHQICIDALSKEKEKISKDLEILKSYDLI